MFPNDQQGNPNRPAWRGSINIGGKEWEISGWEKVSQRGNRFISLEAREPWQGQQQGQTQQAPQQRQAPAPAPQQYSPRQQAQPNPPAQPQRQYRQATTPVNQDAGEDLPFSQSPGHEDKLPNPFLD